MVGSLTALLCRQNLSRMRCSLIDQNTADVTDALAFSPRACKALTQGRTSPGSASVSNLGVFVVAQGPEVVDGRRQLFPEVGRTGHNDTIAFGCSKHRIKSRKTIF